MALPPKQTGNTGTIDTGHARVDVTEGHVHVVDSTNNYTKESNNTSPAEDSLQIQCLLQDILFELRLMNRYSRVILGEDLRQDEEEDDRNN